MNKFDQGFGRTPALDNAHSLARERLREPAQVPITAAGQPCRHCKTPVVKKTRDGEPQQKGRAFYYAWWFKCPNKKCRAIYLSEDAKRVFSEDYSA